MFNYERESTTFWMDFTIADMFGEDAIKDTYNRAFKEWRKHYKYLTELVMVLNGKCWSYYEVNELYCELYRELYYEAHEWALDNLKGNELRFYLSITD